MNNFDKFLDFRKKYNTFIYDKFDIMDNPDNYEITYYFSIPGLCNFNPKLYIDKKQISNNINNINNEFVNYLVFNIGMVELISYIKCTCSPNIIVNCGYLDDYQINWFKKLYYNGLGELLYKNGIETTQDELFNITCSDKKYEFNIEYNGSGNLIPVGGGKDSNVTLSLLEGMDNTCFIINPKGANIECANVAGYSDKTFTVKRVIDKNLFDLNDKGFLNGHTPFSAVVAFVSYLCAYLSNKKYIVLSNEDSANESTVIGTDINHQYSKTFEFENDFYNYTKKYFNIDIKYFSLLRPLTEFQIGMLFSKLEKFHKVFKSCNIGSKGDTWEWCCECPKCLFVFIILSPFLYKDKLINIFGKDLYEDSSLLDTFKELLGYSETKPFECVGTYGEVRFAVSLLINQLGDDLPYLLRYYKDNYPLSLDTDYRLHYSNENNLDSTFESIVKDAISNVQ